MNEKERKHLERISNARAKHYVHNVIDTIRRLRAMNGDGTPERVREELGKLVPVRPPEGSKTGRVENSFVSRVNQWRLEKPGTGKTLPGTEENPAQTERGATAGDKIANAGPFEEDKHPRNPGGQFTVKDEIAIASGRTPSEHRAFYAGKGMEIHAHALGERAKNDPEALAALRKAKEDAGKGMEQAKAVARDLPSDYAIQDAVDHAMKHQFFSEALQKANETISNRATEDDDDTSEASDDVLAVANTLGNYFAPVRERLKSISELDDAEEMRDGLDSLRKELPNLMAASFKRDQTANELKRIMNEDFFEGVFEASEVEPKEKHHWGVFALGLGSAIAAGTMLKQYSDAERIGNDIAERADAVTKLLIAELYGGLAKQLESLRSESGDTSEKAEEIASSIDRIMTAFGYDPKAESDLSRDLAVQESVDIAAQTAKGFGQFKIQRLPSSLERVPYQLFFRQYPRQVWRPWPELWIEDGGPPLVPHVESDYPEGLMAAPIGSPLWGNLNRINPGDPWPPYRWNSGMRTRPMTREECLQKGIIKDDYKPEPVEDQNLNDNTVFDPSIPDDLDDVLKSVIGDWMDEPIENKIKAMGLLSNSDHTDPDPTPAQKVAGNYAKRIVKFGPLDLSVENEKGGIRSKEDEDGNTLWAVEMPATYGYIVRVNGQTAPRGSDSDHVDVFVSDEPFDVSRPVFVINQNNADTGNFDETKWMLNFKNEADARNVYERSFSDGRANERLGSIQQTTLDHFVGWLEDGDTAGEYLANTNAYDDKFSSIHARWAQGDWPELTGEKKSDGPGIMPTKPAEST
jgi:inorganic pyrophosphatase-like protein